MARLFVLGVIILSIGATAGCVDGGRGTKPLVSEPVFYARNVKAYGETAAGLPPEVAYGWDVTVVGDVARWRECSAASAGDPQAPVAIDACGQVERTRPARELLGMKHVADVDVDGQKVEVQKLALAPRPTYIVPTWKPASR